MTGTAPAAGTPAGPGAAPAAGTPAGPGAAGAAFRLGAGPMLPSADPFGEGLVKAPGPAARRAEELGFELVWAGDHIQFHSEMLENAVTLAAAAGATSRIRVAAGVMLVAIRPPALVAKQVAALQVVSGGRFLLGVGVGGENPPEWEAMGVDVRTRGRRTNELLEALPRLLAGEAVTLPDGTPIPPLRPVAPMPPVWVGGRAEAALRRAARFGEAWLGLFLEPRHIGPRREQLAAFAEEAGRPVPAVTLCVFAAVCHSAAALDDVRRFMEGSYRVPWEKVERYVVAGSAAEVAERLAAYREAGVEGLQLIPAARDAVAQYEPLAEALALLGPAARA